MGRLERGVLIVVDDVIGWSDERCELVGAAGVPHTGEWRKVGHVVAPGVGNRVRLYHSSGGIRRRSNGMTHRNEHDAYAAFQEGTRLLESDNAHAAVIAHPRDDAVERP